MCLLCINWEYTFNIVTLLSIFLDALILRYLHESCNIGHAAQLFALCVLFQTRYVLCRLVVIPAYAG